LRFFNQSLGKRGKDAIESFTAFLGRSPDTAAAEDVRRFQVHLTETGVGPSSINQAATALRFFFGPTVDRPELARHLARVHYPRKLPRVQVSHAKYRSVSVGEHACAFVSSTGRPKKDLASGHLRVAPFIYIRVPLAATSADALVL
jgi:integrase/recombinase XerD